jgi:hypothetical protein
LRQLLKVVRVCPVDEGDYFGGQLLGLGGRWQHRADKYAPNRRFDT